LTSLFSSFHSCYISIWVEQGAVPCTGFQHLSILHCQLRSDAPSTELNVVFLLAVLGLDTETTALLRVRT